MRGDRLFSPTTFSVDIGNIRRIRLEPKGMAFVGDVVVRMPDPIEDGRNTEISISVTIPVEEGDSIERLESAFLDRAAEQLARAAGHLGGGGLFTEYLDSIAGPAIPD